MIDIILLIIAGYLLLSFTFVFYIAVMHMKKLKDEIDLRVKVIAGPAVIIGLGFYLILNITVGTVLFLQVPNSLQFTSRCERNLKKRDGSWRYLQAVWWCDLLSIFDRPHCKP